MTGMGWLDFLGFGGGERPPSDPDSAQTIRKIVDQLGQMEPEKARYVAAFAYLLGRVANADLDISAAETREMEHIVERMGGLPEEQAVLVVQIAKTQNKLMGGTEDFNITQALNDIATRPQKLALLNCLFAVSSSDHSISTLEDNEIRKISRELRLDHSDFIQARLAYKEYLEVLKKDE
ncbi:MAG: hypothetical protein GC160_03210 [Acidobacteria bacterium]|nr:hypothetical protein [Acidobacteriota bacterium]